MILNKISLIELKLFNIDRIIKQNATQAQLRSEFY